MYSLLIMLIRVHGPVKGARYCNLEVVSSSHITNKKKIIKFNNVKYVQHRVNIENYTSPPQRLATAK